MWVKSCLATCSQPGQATWSQTSHSLCLSEVSKGEDFLSLLSSVLRPELRFPEILQQGKKEKKVSTLTWNNSGRGCCWQAYSWPWQYDGLLQTIRNIPGKMHRHFLIHIFQIIHQSVDYTTGQELRSRWSSQAVFALQKAPADKVYACIVCLI